MNPEIKAAWLASMPSEGRNEQLCMRLGDNYDPWGLLCKLHGRYSWVEVGIHEPTGLMAYSYSNQAWRPCTSVLEWAGIASPSSIALRNPQTMCTSVLEWAGIDSGDYLAASFGVYMEDWSTIKNNIKRWF